MAMSRREDAVAVGARNGACRAPQRAEFDAVEIQPAPRLSCALDASRRSRCVATATVGSATADRRARPRPGASDRRRQDSVTSVARAVVPCMRSGRAVGARGAELRSSASA